MQLVVYCTRFSRIRSEFLRLVYIQILAMHELCLQSLYLTKNYPLNFTSPILANRYLLLDHFSHPCTMQCTMHRLTVHSAHSEISLEWNWWKRPEKQSTDPAFQFYYWIGANSKKCWKLFQILLTMKSTHTNTGNALHSREKKLQVVKVRPSKFWWLMNSLVVR